MADHTGGARATARTPSGDQRSEDSSLLRLLRYSHINSSVVREFLDVSLQFAEDLRTPPVYYAQLFAFAQGDDDARLTFPRQKRKPDCLRRFEKRGAAKEALNGTAGTGCEYCGAVTDLLPDGSAEGVFYCRPCLERFARHDTQIRERGETESGADA